MHIKADSTVLLRLWKSHAGIGEVPNRRKGRLKMRLQGRRTGQDRWAMLSCAVLWHSSARAELTCPGTRSVAVLSQCCYSFFIRGLPRPFRCQVCIKAVRTSRGASSRCPAVAGTWPAARWQCAGSQHSCSQLRQVCPIPSTPSSV